VTLEVREWLPADVIAGDGVRTRLTGAIAEWSERWFSRGNFKGTSLLPIAPGESIDLESNWTILGGDIAIRMSKAAQSRLEALALDIELGGVAPTEADSQVLASFGQALIADLGETLERYFGEGLGEQPPGAFDPAGAMVARVSADGDPLFTLALTRRLLTARCKADIGPLRDGRLDPESLMGALGPSVATVQASLGAVQLSLAELRHLAPGDVVVLDAAVADGGTLGAPGDGPAIARCLLGQSDGRLSLILQPLPQ
jgi:hypothetical protein